MQAQPLAFACVPARALFAVLVAVSSSSTGLAQSSLVTRRDFPAGGRSASAIAHADFDANGAEDLAVALKGQDSTMTTIHDQLVILRGDPAQPGAFLEPAGQPANSVTRFDVGTITDSNPVALVIANLDAGTNPDIVCANVSNSSLTIIRNPLTGSTVTHLTTRASPQALATGDFNGDLKADIAVGFGTNPGKVSVFLGDGLGGLVQESGSPYTIGNNVTGVGSGDFDGDGKPDLTAVTRGDQKLWFFRRKASNNGFHNAQSMSILPNPVSLVVADVINDTNFPSIPEVLIARDDPDDRALSVVQRNGPTSFLENTWRIPFPSVATVSLSPHSSSIRRRTRP